MSRIGWSREATVNALFDARRRATNIAGKMMDLSGEVQDGPIVFSLDLRRSAGKAYAIADSCRDADADLSSGVGWLPSRLMLPGFFKAIERYERHYSEIVSGLEAGRKAFKEHSIFADKKAD